MFHPRLLVTALAPRLGCYLISRRSLALTTRADAGHILSNTLLWLLQAHFFPNPMLICQILCSTGVRGDNVFYMHLCVPT